MLVQVRNGCLEGRETKYQEAESDDALTYAAGAVVLVEGKYKSQCYQRDGEGGNIHAESENCYEPGGYRGTDIGSHNHSDGIAERQ